MMHIYVRDEKCGSYAHILDTQEMVLKALQGKIPRKLGHESSATRVLLEPCTYKCTYSGFVGTQHPGATFFYAYVLCGGTVLDYGIVIAQTREDQAPSPSP